MRGDPTRLRQALLNYAANAGKLAAQGSITLGSRVVEERANELLIRFSVEDTGTRLKPEVIARLFQVFEQANTSTIRQFGGTGLGLSITRQLTANAFAGDRQACEAAGMNDFVGKPIAAQDLYQALLKWLDIQAKVRNPVNPAAIGPQPACE